MKQPQMDNHQVIASANEKKIFIAIPNPGAKKPDLIPAKLSGARLDYPQIYSTDRNNMQFEISWFAARKLASGEIDHILA